MEIAYGIVLAIIYTVAALFCWLVWFGMMIDITKWDDNMSEKAQNWFVFIFGFLPPPIVYSFIIHALITDVFK